MIEIVILALALSMDAFAVAVGLGAKHGRNSKDLGITVGLYFGVFQGLMPAIGYLGGLSLLGWMGDYTPWVACGLLLIIGGKMIFEAFDDGVEEAIAKITHRILMMLAIATSIDAMAAGFSLNLLAINPFVACGVIGLTTWLLSIAGVSIGMKSGVWLENKAEFIGGVVLILIGLKFVIVQ